MELAKRTPPLTATEKVSLLGDEWRMVRSGRHDVGVYLDLAAALASERTPEVTGEMAGRIGVVMSDIAYQNQRQPFDAPIGSMMRRLRTDGSGSRNRWSSDSDRRFTRTSLYS